MYIAFSYKDTKLGHTVELILYIHIILFFSSSYVLHAMCDWSLLHQPPEEDSSRPLNFRPSLIQTPTMIELTCFYIKINGLVVWKRARDAQMAFYVQKYTNKQSVTEIWKKRGQFRTSSRDVIDVTPNWLNSVYIILLFVRNFLNIGYCIHKRRGVREFSFHLHLCDDLFLLLSAEKAKSFAPLQNS